MKINRFSKETKEEIKTFVELCKKEIGNQILSLVLFGSLAKRKYRKTSDYDFLILTKKPVDYDKLKTKLVIKSFGKIKRPVHVDIKSYPSFIKSFNNLSAFPLEIIKTGKTIFGEDIIKKNKSLLNKLLKEGKINLIEKKGVYVWRIAA